MPHHEESPEKPEYNMETPPFCLTPLFLVEMFTPRPISINFGKVKLQPFMKGGGSNYETLAYSLKMKTYSTF